MTEQSQTQDAQLDVQREHQKFVTELGDWHRSHSCGQLTINNDGEDVCLMGWVQYRQGDLAGALATLERAYGMRDDPEIGAHLGEVLWAIGRKDDAQKLLRAAQKKHPDNEPLADAVKKFAD